MSKYMKDLISGVNILKIHLLLVQSAHWSHRSTTLLFTVQAWACDGMTESTVLIQTTITIQSTVYMSIFRH